MSVGDDDALFMATLETQLKKAGTSAEMVFGVVKHPSDRVVKPVWERQGDGAGFALPPCMASISEALSVGQNVGHLPRFSLAAFLLKRQCTSEEIHERFVNAPNYDKRITDNQIAQITERGYAPLGCDKLRAMGLCHADDVCREREVVTPLSYPRRTWS